MKETEKETSTLLYCPNSKAFDFVITKYSAFGSSGTYETHAIQVSTASWVRKCNKWKHFDSEEFDHKYILTLNKIDSLEGTLKRDSVFTTAVKKIKLRVASIDSIVNESDVAVLRGFGN
jgi:hypothetical protein